MAPFAMVYGEVLSPEVTGVEVTWDNGASLRDQPTQGLFGVAINDQVMPCALKVLGEDDTVLDEISLRSPNQVCPES